jgi:enoyl-CoA hydratase/carnithine racemase
MEEVLVDRAAEDAARVRLNRPEVKNALSQGMRALPQRRRFAYKGR